MLLPKLVSLLFKKPWISFDVGAAYIRYLSSDNTQVYVDDCLTHELWPHNTGGQVLVPMRKPTFTSGKVLEFEQAEVYFKSIEKKYRKYGFIASKALAVVSSGSSAIDRRGMQECLEIADFFKILLIETPMAGALGAGMDVEGDAPFLVGVLGATSCEFAVLQHGSIINQSVSAFGWFDVLQSVAFEIRSRFGVWPDQDQLDKALKEIGIDGVIHPHAERAFDDVLSSMQTSIKTNMTADDARQVMLAKLIKLVELMVILQDTLNPEQLSHLRSSGGALVGGMAQLGGLKGWLAREVDLPFYLAKDPQTAVVRGADIAIQRLEKVNPKALQSMY